MRIVFLLRELGDTHAEAVLAQAAHLGASPEVIVSVAFVSGDAFGVSEFRGLSEVSTLTWEEATSLVWDVVIASSWGTALDAFHLDARRQVLILRELEQSAYGPAAPERIGAAMATTLPLHVVATEPWLADTLGLLGGGEPVPVVPDGMWSDTFAPPAAPRPITDGGPVRIAVIGSPEDDTSGGAEALNAVRWMREPAFVTWLAPGPRARPSRVHRVVADLDAAGRAAALRDHHVMVTASRADTHAASVHEAFRMGAAVVATATPAHMEAVQHGVDGLLAGVDDGPGLRESLDLLAQDRGLLDTLRDGALRAGRRRPDWAAAAAVLADELERVLAAPDPSTWRAAGRRMTRDMVGALADVQAAARRADIERTLRERAEQARRAPRRAPAR